MHPRLSDARIRELPGPGAANRCRHSILSSAAATIICWLGVYGWIAAMRAALDRLESCPTACRIQYELGHCNSLEAAVAERWMKSRPRSIFLSWVLVLVA